MRELKIGRGAGNDIIISDQTVSRSHAILIISDSEYSIKDLNSGNGTYINGMRVSGVSILADNDILKVGNVVVPWKNYLSLNSIPENIPKETKESPENNNIESNVSFSEKVNVPSANAALVLGIIGLILFWIPIIGFVLYLGATAIMKGFNAKEANKLEKSEDISNIDSLYDKKHLSDELSKLSELLHNGVLTQEEFEKAKKKILDN